MRAIAVVAAVLGALAQPRIDGQAPALFGTWMVNVAKSTFNPGPPPFKRQTCTIEPWEGRVKVSYDIVGTRGGVVHLEWTGQFDGRDYPVQGADEVLTSAYSQIDDRTYDVLIKSDGTVAATARFALSPDGRTITTVTTARSALGAESSTTTVFEKQ